MGFPPNSRENYTEARFVLETDFADLPVHIPIGDRGNNDGEKPDENIRITN
jgi:hypothetical protein